MKEEFERDVEKLLIIHARLGLLDEGLMAQVISKKLKGEVIEEKRGHRKR